MSVKQMNNYQINSSERMVMQQRWKNILFIHWKVSPEVIQCLLPPGLKVDTYNNDAYVGLVPFEMEAVRFVNTPPIPGTSRFLELNLRTYVVSEKGDPGVWFFSLDAANLVAVTTARSLFQLPYHWCKMSSKCNDEEAKTVHYLSARKSNLLNTKSNSSSSEIVYKRPSAESNFVRAKRETLEYFLVERYLLFSWDKIKSQLYQGRVSHVPYRFAQAKLLRLNTTTFRDSDILEPTEKPCSILYSPGVETKIFQLNSVD